MESTPVGLLRQGCLVTVVASIGLMQAVAVDAHEDEAKPASARPEVTVPPAATDGPTPEGAERPMEERLVPMPGAPYLALPRMDSARGRMLFASKGCVSCHAVNGVGGHDAKALDAHTMQPMMNPFDFAAKMWRMAQAMIYAQEEALGEQIDLTGAQLADIIAFVHDHEEQYRFSEADIPPQIMEMMDHHHGPSGGGATQGKDSGHGDGAETEHHDD